MVSRAQALVFRAIPVVAIMGLALYAIVGRGGLLDNRELARRAEEKRDAWIALEQENDRLVQQIEALGTDPLVVERQAADEHRVTRPGTTLYVFEDDELVRVQ